jgi:mono/diheme cytochrome c family protein
VFRNSLMILGLSLAALLPGCGEEEGEPTGSTCPDDSTLTYESFGQAFFATNCLSCHGSGGPESPKFDTVEQIRSNSAEIDRQAAAGPDATNTFMPETGSVATEERKKLGEWLACGAP